MREAGVFGFFYASTDALALIHWATLVRGCVRGKGGID